MYYDEYIKVQIKLDWILLHHLYTWGQSILLISIYDLCPSFKFVSKQI